MERLFKPTIVSIVFVDPSAYISLPTRLVLYGVQSSTIIDTIIDSFLIETNH